MNNKPTYPVRGFLHSLLEGSTDIEEAEEAINGFIAHAQDRAWKERVRVGTTHNPYKLSGDDLRHDKTNDYRLYVNKCRESLDGY